METKRHWFWVLSFEIKGLGILEAVASLNNFVVEFLERIIEFIWNTTSIPFLPNSGTFPGTPFGFLPFFSLVFQPFINTTKSCFLSLNLPINTDKVIVYQLHPIITMKGWISSNLPFTIWSVIKERRVIPLGSFQFCIILLPACGKCLAPMNIFIALW